MRGSEKFRRDAGLDGPFDEARERLRRGPRVISVPHEDRNATPAVLRLRKRFEDDVVKTQSGPADGLTLEVAITRLQLVSPTYLPPTDEDIQRTRGTVKLALRAVAMAVKTFKKSEEGAAWYLDKVEVPGFENGIDGIHPGMAMRGRLDPVVPLLICRDLLQKYVNDLDAAASAANVGRKPRRNAMREQIVQTLLEAAVPSKDIVAVLLYNGIPATAHAVDLQALALRRRGNKQPARGGAPRGRGKRPR